MAIYVVFLISGVGGLIYEVIWIRQFGIIFGNNIHSSSLVAGLFLSGMGLGSWLLGVWGDNHHGPGSRGLLRLYGYLELTIAIWGLVAALLLPHLEFMSSSLSWYTPTPEGWFELSGASHLFRYLVAIIMIFPITVAMGGTLPLLIKFVVSNKLQKVGIRTGLLYALNTLGAAMGSFLVDFTLIPNLGLLASQSLAVVCNLIASLCAFGLAARVPAQVQMPGHARSYIPQMERKSLAVALSLLVMGFVAMGLQTVWYRYLIGLLGNYRSVLSILLTLILLGIALGAAVGGYLAKHLKSSRTGLIWSQAIFLASALLCLMLPVGEWANSNTYVALATRGWHLGYGQLTQVFFLLQIAGAVVALPSFFSGLAFPLANAAIQQTTGSVASQSGLLYLANSMGAVLGAVIVAFVALPRLGMQHSIGFLAALMLFGTGLLGSGGMCRHFISGISILTAVTLAWWSLAPDRLATQVYLPLPPALGHYLALKEGLQESVAVVESANHKSRTLLTNGHPMSDSTESAARYMRIFSHVPLLILPNPERVLVICFGVGNTLHAASLHQSVREIEIADLSRNVLEHAPYFSATNHNVLRDSRVHVFINDGRQHLRMHANADYDLITLEPPPISFAGVSSLYSSEFYRLARSRLRQGGFFTQWLPYYEVPEAQVRSIIRAFVEVFPDAVLLGGSLGNFILMGRKDAPNVVNAKDLAQRLDKNPAVADDLKAIHMGTLTEIVGSFIGSPTSLRRVSENSQPISDDYPIMEYSVTAFLESTMPPNLVDVRSLPDWCPTCFKDGRPINSMKNLDLYSSVVAQLYRMNSAFSELRPLAYVLPVLNQNDPRLRATIQDSEYLRQYWPNAPGH